MQVHSSPTIMSCFLLAHSSFLSLSFCSSSKFSLAAALYYLQLTVQLTFSQKNNRNVLEVSLSDANQLSHCLYPSDLSMLERFLGLLSVPFDISALTRLSFAKSLILADDAAYAMSSFGSLVSTWFKALNTSQLIQSRLSSCGPCELCELCATKTQNIGQLNF